MFAWMDGKQLIAKDEDKMYPKQAPRGTHPIQDLQLSGKFLSEGLGIGDGILAHLHHVLDILLLTCVQFLVVVQSVLVTASNTLTLATRDRL